MWECQPSPRWIHSGSRVRMTTKNPMRTSSSKDKSLIKFSWKSDHFPGDISPIVRKCLILQCWRILEEIPTCWSRGGQLPKDQLKLKLLTDKQIHKRRVKHNVLGRRNDILAALGTSISVLDRWNETSRDAYLSVRQATVLWILNARHSFRQIWQKDTTGQIRVVA